jgi:aspartyl protease family protein
MADGDGPWGGEQPPRLPARRPKTGLFLWLGLLALSGVALIWLSHLVPGQIGGSDGFEIVRLFGLLALVSSGLVAARRIDFGATARRAALWAAIVMVLCLGYAFRDDAVVAALRLRAAMFPEFAVADTPRSVVIGRSVDGGFYVMGEVNGARVRFLVDTGATEIVLSPADAARAGLDTAKMEFSHPNETANGVGYGARTIVERLAVGPIRLADVPVAVNQAPMSASLLGMPFLQRLESFEVRGDELILHGKP